MSAPPTSSPLTNSCGIVGQFDSADSSWRMRGSGSTSTAANDASSVWRAPAVRAEKPHIGCSGVPFMKRITGFDLIASSIASRRGFCVSSLTVESSLGLGLQGKGVDAVAELAVEDVVDEAMLGDPRESRERRGGDDRLEVVPVIAGDLGSRAGDAGLDARLELFFGCRADSHCAQG